MKVAPGPPRSSRTLRPPFAPTSPSKAGAAGLCLLGLGVVLLFLYAVVREWSLYGIVTPALISVGGALVAYAPPPPARRVVRILCWVVIGACAFWTTATVAQWTGRGLATYQALHLDQLPSVIVDTHERLYLRSPGVEETVLRAAPGQTYHFRYRRLRLLIHGHDRMFLVPERWSASNTTLMVPLDGSVRVQFQFQNDAP